MNDAGMVYPDQIRQKPVRIVGHLELPVDYPVNLRPKAEPIRVYTGDRKALRK